MYEIKTNKEIKDNKVIINDHVFMVTDSVARQIHELCLKGVVNTEKKVEKKVEKKPVKVSEKKNNNYSSSNGRIQCRRFTNNFTFQYAKKGEGYILDLPFHVNKTLWRLIDKRFKEAGFEYDPCTESYINGDIKKLNNVITVKQWDDHCTRLEKWWNREK